MSYSEFHTLSRMIGKDREKFEEFKKETIRVFNKSSKISQANDEKLARENIMLREKLNELLKLHNLEPLEEFERASNKKEEELER